MAYNEGLGANWKPRRTFWDDRAAKESTLRTNHLSLPTTRTSHVGNDPSVERYDPDLWTDEFAFLNQPGQAGIQNDLFYDYRTNVDAYPKWQAIPGNNDAAPVRIQQDLAGIKPHPVRRIEAPLNPIPPLPA
jgi:hypothetical protein